MRLLVVNVNTSSSMTEAITATARRAAAPGTEIVGLTPRFGPPSVEGHFESYLSAVAVMDRVLAHDDPYDAVVQAGFGEHGREGLQELLDAPVVDITEALVELELSTSKVGAYAPPNREHIPGWPMTSSRSA